MRLGIVGLVTAAVALTAAGTALGAGQIKIGTDPASTSGRYNGTDPSGGAFVITKVTDGDHGLFGGNRTAGDNTTLATEYNKRLTSGGVELSFLSFCIERNEYIANGGTYFTELSTSARFGGEGGASGGQDPLGSPTALLYSQFRQIGYDGVVPNTLFNGLITDGVWNSDDSTALQMAIWKSENENVSLSGLALSLYNWAQGAADGSLYDVRVLRLWDTYNAQTGEYSGQHQDQLTLIPLPPAAWAGLSTLAGVGFVGYVRRRKNAAQ